MNVSPFILACFAACMAGAQTDLGSAFVVHVVNSLTRAPIAGANVVLADAQGENLWGRTDAGGAFTGRVRSAGSHLLTLTCKGLGPEWKLRLQWRCSRSAFWPAASWRIKMPTPLWNRRVACKLCRWISLL